MIAHDPSRKIRVATIMIIVVVIWTLFLLVLTSYASAAPEDVFGHIPRFCDLFYSVIGDANYRIQNYELAYINGEWYIGYTVYRQVSGVWGHYTNGLLVAGQAYPETWHIPALGWAGRGLIWYASTDGMKYNFRVVCLITYLPLVMR